MTSQFADAIVIFFQAVLFFFSIVMTIYLYKPFTRNPEIRNILVSVLPNIRSLGRIRDTYVFNIMIHMSYVRDTYVSNEMLINDVKCQGYTFYYF